MSRITHILTPQEIHSLINKCIIRKILENEFCVSHESTDQTFDSSATLRSISVNEYMEWYEFLSLSFGSYMFLCFCLS